MILERSLRNFLTARNGWAVLSCVLTLGVWLALAPDARAGFVGPYALSNFTLVNTNADGSAMTPDGGLSMVLTGGNNGSGLFGTTDFVVTAVGTGFVKFDYSYATLDLPQFDFAGYLLNGVFSILASGDGQSGSSMFAVTSGQTFGFRVETEDNLGEQGILTVSNFSAPAATAAVPEPAALPVTLLAMAALAAFRRMKKRTS